MDNLNSHQRQPSDLAIIGGGPAGTAAAIEARRLGLVVSIWEKASFPRDKVCGEFISSEGLPFLREAIPGALSRAAAIRRAAFITPSGKTYGMDFREPAAGLSRSVLDAALWDAARLAQADVQGERAITELSRTGHGANRVWEIKSADGVAGQARAVIITCGRWWKIKGLASPSEQIGGRQAGQWVGIKAHFAGIAPRDAVEMYFFRGGYCGLAPIENGLYNVCFLASRERRESIDLDHIAEWLAAAARHPALDSRLRGARQVSRAVATAPVFPGRRCRAAQTGALLAGDAAGFLDPFTGEGISIALHGGRLAAKAIAECLRNGRELEEVQKWYSHSLWRSVRSRFRAAALVRQLLRPPFYAHASAALLLSSLGRLKEARL